MNDLVSEVITGGLIGLGTTIVGMVGYVTYMCAAEKGHGWIVIVIAGFALFWVLDYLFPTGLGVGVSVTGFAASFLIGRAVEREAAAQAKRDE